MIISQHLVPTDPSSLRAALQTWKQQWPAHSVLALLPEQEKDHVKDLQDACGQLDIPLWGAIFPALVQDSAFVTQGVWLLCLTGSPHGFLVEDVHDRGGEKLAQALAEQLPSAGTSTTQTLMLIFDAMVPDIASILDAMHQKLPNAPAYGGVSAGSESFQPMPCLFDNTRLLGNGALGLLLPIGSRAVVRHAYPVSQSLMRATSATGNRIVTIDDRPAFSVYQRMVREEYGVDLTAENFYTLAVHFPFGVVTAFDVLVRIPVALGDDGSLNCVGEIPPDSMLRLLRAPALDESACVEELRAALQADQGACAGRALLAFYCAGRRMHFGEASRQELNQLRQRTDATHVYGALSLGEIDSLEDFDFPRFHNAAVVCITDGQS